MRIGLVRLVSLAAAAALTLGACGEDAGDDAQADVGREESAASPEPPPEPSDEPTNEPTDEPTADSDLPDGWTRAETDDFSIGLPPGWFNGERALDDEEFLAEVASQAAGITDDAVAALIADGLGELDLLAFKIDDLTSGFSTNINAVAERRGPFDDVDPIRELAPTEIETVGATSVEVDDYEVNGLPVVELTYDLPEFGAKGIQNYLLAEELVVVATYTATDPDPELWQSVLETVVIAD